MFGLLAGFWHRAPSHPCDLSDRREGCLLSFIINISQLHECSVHISEQLSEDGVPGPENQPCNWSVGLFRCTQDLWEGEKGWGLRQSPEAGVTAPAV